MLALCRLNGARGRLEGFADSDLTPGGGPRSYDAHFGLYDGTTLTRRTILHEYTR
jgi:hypothetical protein